MGRVKLEIKRIENTNNRLVTFAKRKAGLIKKAQELATLCDIDVALIMFSPSNKLTQYATNARIEDIISRYADVPEGERMKRKMENLQQLNRAIRKLKGEHETGNMSSFTSYKGEFGAEYAQQELARLKSENEQFQRRLRLFQGDDAALSPLSFEELVQMELQIQNIVEKVRLRKMLILDYNMKEAAFGCHPWLQQKDASFRDETENPGFYAGDQGSFPSNLDFNQQAVGFTPGGSHPMLEDLGEQSMNMVVECGEQSMVVDNNDNYQDQPFQHLLDPDYAVEAQVDSSQ